MLYIGALAVLVLYLIFAFNNRFLGREFYAPRLGALPAHWVGVAIQVGFVIVVTFMYLEWLRGDYTRAQLWGIGVLWAVVAEVWELLIVRRTQRLSWSDALADYNPLAGRGWWLVPLAYLLAPVLVHDWAVAL